MNSENIINALFTYEPLVFAVEFFAIALTVVFIVHVALELRQISKLQRGDSDSPPHFPTNLLLPPGVLFSEKVRR